MIGNRRDYLKWKRKNVTLRGVKELGKPNGVYGSWGRGLYTCHLTNRAMAKTYGKVYFVVNARPKNPKKFRGVNDAEIFRQQFDDDDVKMQTELLTNGFDGIEIIGREMVLFEPDNNVRYFENEAQVEAYYENVVEGK